MPCGETSLKRLEHFLKKKKEKKETKEKKGTKERSLKSQKQTGHMNRGGGGEWAALFFQDIVSGISLVTYTTHIIYSNSRLINQASGWNLSSPAHLSTKGDGACHDNVSILVCRSYYRYVHQSLRSG